MRSEPRRKDTEGGVGVVGGGRAAEDFAFGVISKQGPKTLDENREGARRTPRLKNSEIDFEP